MTVRLHYIVPSVFEVVGSVFAAIAVVVLANSRQLLGYYGLQSSNEVIKTSAGGAVSNALQKVDSLSATDGIVTFLIWAGIGVVCFSVVQGIIRAYHEFEFDEELSSNKYIHPATFTRAKFWTGLAEDFVGTAVGLLLVAAAVIGFVFVALPLGLAYSKEFLFNVSLTNTVYLLLGLAVVFVALLLVDVCVRVLLLRRRIVRG